MTALDENGARALLRWYAEMGVDEAVATSPADYYAWDGAPPPLTRRAPSLTPASLAPASASAEPKAPLPVFTPTGEERLSVDEAIAAAREAARKSDTLEALEAAVTAFDGCPLKAGATKTVFADGAPGADLLIIGEAPGRDEDRIGKPFVGRAGQLLDRMLAAIDRSRDRNVLISNVVYWRPPGNRAPTAIETAICRPFVDRLIDLTEPSVIVLAGGAPLQALLDVTGIMRARGVWRELSTASGRKVPVLPIFHPAFLLRQPAHKRHAWTDLKTLEKRLSED